jgi:hypothetical protein
MKQTLEIIKLIIDQYEKDSHNLSIERLLRAQDRLSTRSYYLAEICSDYRDNKNSSFYAYDNALNSSEYNYAQEGEKTLSAKNKARYDNIKLKDDMMVSENIYKRLKMLLLQVNRILSSIQQRISYLKAEKQSLNS